MQLKLLSGYKYHGSQYNPLPYHKVCYIMALHEEQNQERQKSLVQRTGELMNDLLIEDGETTQTESTIELNLMAVKFKHTVKRTKKKPEC